MPLPAPCGFLFWYTTSVILLILTLINIISKLSAYVSRPSPTTALTALPAPVSSPGSPRLKLEQVESGVKPSLSTLTRASRAGRVIFEKYVLLTALPLPKIRWWIKKRAEKSSVSTTELIWQVGYVTLVLMLSFWGASWDILTISNQAAWIAVAQVPLIIALAGKNNLVAFLTGIPYEKLNFLHRASGRMCLAGVWIHAILHWTIMKGFSIHQWHTHISQWGATGTIAISMLYATSLPYFRRKLYEFFLITHIALAALTLAAFIMHWRKVDVWIYPGVGLWVADRLFRMLRLVFLNHLWTVRPSPTASNLPSTATLTLLTPSTLMVSFQTPSRLLTWSAGQHFYVVMPGMSRLPWEAHPFTATTIPKRAGHGTESGELTFVVRVRDGFTKRMKDEVDKERKARGLGVEEECKITVQAAVEGPYGKGTDMSRNNGVVIISGGSGISFALSHLLQIIRDAKEGKTNVRDVRVIWMVKSRLHLNWIAPILLQHVHSIPSSLRVTLHIHVTRHYFPRMTGGSMCLPPGSVLPTNPGTEEMNDFQKFLARRTAEPKRRKSRLMSTMSWATWTGPYDEDGQTGPGTRRGTILPEEVAKLKPAKKLSRKEVEKEEKLEKEQMDQMDEAVVPTFSWTEGYTDNEIPSDFGVLRNNPKRRASEMPSFDAVREDEDVDLSPDDVAPDVSPFGSVDGRDSRDVSPFSSANNRGRVSLAVSSAQEVSPFSSVNSRNRMSLEVPSPSPSPVRGRPSLVVDYSAPDAPADPRMSLDVPTRFSASFSPDAPRSPRSHSPFASAPPRFGSPFLPDAAEGSRMSLDVPQFISPFDSSAPRFTSPFSPTPPVTPPPAAARRISISIEEPDHPRRKSSGRSSTAGSRRLSIIAPQPRRPSPLLNVTMQTDIDPTSTYSSVSREEVSPDTILPPTSILSPTPSLSPSPAPRLDSGALTPLSPSPAPQLGSGALTPALAETGAKNFEEDLLSRRRQSIGLESIIRWHEGRANLEAVVKEMMEEVGQGGWISVNACGPKSLLDSARKTVREVSTVKGAWRGEVGVSFHAETFGW